MNISSKGIDLIKRFEGFSAEPYLCPAGVPTIGYGHTQDVQIPGDAITEVKAEAFLREDVQVAESAIEKHCIVRLYQYEFDALASFIFNVGSGHFIKSTLLKMLNKSDYDAAADEFERWVFAKGKVLPGLVIRRESERDLFKGLG